MHWRIALQCVAWASVVALLAGAAIWYLYDASYAGSFLYGVGIGLLSFVSMAATVSLLTGRSAAGVLGVGAGSFAVRCGFVAGSLGVPAYLNLWPAATMLGGFGVIYLAETVVLLPMMFRKVGHPDAKKLR